MLSAQYIDKGAEKTVIMLHGILAYHDQLRPLFGINANIVAFDLPGHGDSTSEGKPMLEDAVKQIRAFLKKHRIQSYYLLGYSLGTFVSQALLEAGEKPEGIILLSGALQLSHQHFVSKHNLLEKSVPLVQKYASLIDRCVIMYRDHIQEGYSMEDRVDVKKALVYLEELYGRNFLDTCKKYKGKALILHGTKDLVIPIAYGVELSEAFENSELHTFPGGHDALLRNPKLYGLIQNFIS